jgi:hypothetical protein
MAKKKTIKKDDSSLLLPIDPELAKWPTFQENNTLYIFHFCGENEKSQWFRKTNDWENGKPKCEVCNELVPGRIASLVKIHMSGL